MLAPKGTFIFTTLDREDSLYSMVFSDQDNIEHDIAKNSSLIEEGEDRPRHDIHTRPDSS